MSLLERTAPNLPETLKRLTETRLAEVHTCMPAVVIAYDATKERADVQPLLQRRYRFPDGSTQLIDLPPVLAAPVAWPRFGGWLIRGELASGDVVELRFSERSLERWLAAQDQTQSVDPSDTRKHDLSDAIVSPGMVPHDTDGQADLTIGRADGSSEIRLTAAGEISLSAGGAADQHLVRGEELNQWLQTHTHPTSFGPSGPPIQPIPPTVLSSTAKVK